MHGKFMGRGLAALLILALIGMLGASVVYNMGLSQGRMQGALLSGAGEGNATLPYLLYGSGFRPFGGFGLFGLFLLLMFVFFVGRMLFGGRRHAWRRHGWGPHGPWDEGRDADARPEQGQPSEGPDAQDRPFGRSGPRFGGERAFQTRVEEWHRRMHEEMETRGAQDKPDEQGEIY